MIDIQKLALEAYPEKLVTVGDNPELWDENEQYRECWIEGYNKALIIQRVSQQRELLIAYEKNHYTPQEWALASKQCIEDIDNFLAINCG